MLPISQSTGNIKLHNGGKKSMIMYTCEIDASTAIKIRQFS